MRCDDKQRPKWSLEALPLQHYPQCGPKIEIRRASPRLGNLVDEDKQLGWHCRTLDRTIPSRQVRSWRKRSLGRGRRCSSELAWSETPFGSSRRRPAIEEGLASIPAAVSSWERTLNRISKRAVREKRLDEKGTWSNAFLWKGLLEGSISNKG